VTGPGAGVDLAAALVGASSDRSGLPGRAVVAVTVGGGDELVIEIVDGRATGPGPADEVEVAVSISADRFSAFLSGDDSLAQAFMRGDVKPVGSTGPLLALVELLEDPEVRRRLAAAGSD
jgi:hypothetical protein